MTTWKYIGKVRKNILGKWYTDGLHVISKRRPSTEFVKVGEEPPKPKGYESGGETIEERLRMMMMKLKMSDLQFIGHKYGASDTKKSELTQEILDAADDRKELMDKIIQIKKTRGEL